MSPRQGNVQWVDGLRGFASILVVVTHLARAFDDGLFRSTQNEGEAPRFLQQPFIRVFVQGRIGVAIFSLVTGYVCALKPIQHFRDGNQPIAFRGIAKGAFRRVPRLVLPTSIITCLIWIICEFGAFKQAKRANSWWLNAMSPTPKATFRISIKSLLLALTTTWTRDHNPYDPNQWNLPPLLKGALHVYIMLIATSFCRARYRMLISLILYIYYYFGNEAVFGMQFFFGTFLSDLSQSETHLSFLKRHPWLFRLLSPLLLTFGLFIASFPENGAERLPWSRTLIYYGGFIFPSNASVPHYYTAFGLQSITLAIHFSSSAKQVLSNRLFLWLGRHSYAIYLIHGTLIRTVGTWMFFGYALPTPEVKDDGSIDLGPQLQICTKLKWYTRMPFFWVLLYACAMIWTRWVDPSCARVTEMMVKKMFEEEDMRTPVRRGSSAGSSEVDEREAEKSLLTLLPR